MARGKRPRLEVLRHVLGITTLLLAASSSTTAEAQQTVRVIVHPDVAVAALDEAELQRIYLGKKTFWDSGSRISPSLLDEQSPVTESFLEGNIKKTVRQYHAYWKRRLFSGQGTAPRTFSSSRQVADYVADNPGAIGVVDSGYIDDRVKVIGLER